MVKGSCNADTLPLPAGQPDAPVSYEGIQPIRKPFDEII